MEIWYAEIINIGNEILTGRTVNTNASHIARRLTSLGYTVRRITVVRDEIEEIVSAFKEAISRRPKIIISTGGLGPTYDDKTNEGLAKALNIELELNEIAYKMLLEKYSKLNIEITEERRKMAIMPKGSIPVENNVGVAPGILILYQGITILATPGVPKEMEDVVENFIKKYLKDRPNVKYLETSFLLEGVMESTIAPYVKQLVKKYDLYIKTHPKGQELSKPLLEIQIAGSSENEAEIKERIQKASEELKEIGVKLGGVITQS
ncbi:nicotinamide mononucleotide deamidase-related protein [Sulfolobus sp. S-194]|uniref:nicotinamide mononucleotide deamidase-related protein n=1 Tax=Sulfolobus sp. S-194 TaxID=2512240 RepID=UPI001436EDF1|nr:nicotinamide mononucleotide deamidase-related protein [Sulfolobus sp. S-194]QIW24292.1 nicotinamide mononucleotide deamidase-related protein [Sulfolobus sp. S-194]